MKNEYQSKTDVLNYKHLNVVRYWERVPPTFFVFSVLPLSRLFLLLFTFPLKLAY